MKDKEIDIIVNSGKKFYDDLTQNENGRYKSWEHCYKVFNEAHNTENVDELFIDYLCLHLSFYLASWGMYRGSSFLLQKDYKVHKPVVEEILKDKYNCLWNIEINEYKNKEVQAVLIDLVNNIKNIYNEIRLSVKEKTKNEVSNTLVTKVLMATMGCVPAYDRFFVSGIKKYNVASGTFNIKSILRLVDYYNKNIEKFEEVRKQMKIDNLKYPKMKVIDMCFWKVGIDL